MNSQVHFRMNEQEKAALTNLYRTQELSINDTVLAVGDFPFELNNPNVRLQATINSADYVNFASLKKDWLS